MIRLLLLAVFALTLGGGLAWYLRADSGYVMLSYGNWVLESSLLGAAAALLVLVAALYYGFRLLLAGVGLPARLREALERRRSDLARDSFEAGLLRLQEGHWRQAEIELVRRAADHHAAHLNYLFAARAAQRLDVADRREHYLRLAAQGEDNEIRFAALLMRAELQRERGEYAAARDSVLELRTRDLRHPYVLALLAECHAALADWEALHLLLREPDAAGALPAARYRELLGLALQRRLAEAVEAASLEHFKRIWELAPRDYREDPALLATYIEGLARLNAEAEAVALITAQLNRAWDARLLTLFGRLRAADPLGQLAAVEHWLGQYGERPELQLAAGQVCARNKLWGKARSYLEALLRSTPSVQAYLELARICEATQSKAEADRYYRLGLELAAEG